MKLAGMVSMVCAVSTAHADSIPAFQKAEPAKIHAEIEGTGIEKGKFYITAGYGVVNLSAPLINGIKNSIDQQWASLVVKGYPIWMGKAEYSITPHSGIALNFAYTGVDINARLDSLNQFNAPIEGKLTYRTYSFLARYNYHLLVSNNWDVYAGIGVGFRANNFRVEDNDPNKDRWDFPIDLSFVTKRIPNKLSLPTVGGDFTFGVKYFILPGVAIYAETGIAKSILQTGLTVRF